MFYCVHSSDDNYGFYIESKRIFMISNCNLHSKLTGSSQAYTLRPLQLRVFSYFNVGSVSGGSRMGHLGQMPPPPPFKKLHTRSRYSNRAVNYSNKAVTMFMKQCSLPMKLQIGFYFA